MYNFCGAMLIDDIYIDEYFERVANAKKLIHQYIRALEGLAENNVFFEILRPENVRFTDTGSALHIVDIPYVIDTREDQLGSGFQNESSPPETLMEQVYSPAKSTVWSVGVFLYRLLYKEFPFSCRFLSPKPLDR